MGTMDIMASAPIYMNNQREVSKLSRWLALDSVSTTSFDEQTSSIGSQAVNGAGLDSFDSDSTHSSNNASQRQSPQVVGQQQQYLSKRTSPTVGESNECANTMRGWNVNAESFQPVFFRNQAPSPLPSMYQQQQPIAHQHHYQQPNDFSFPPPAVVAANALYPTTQSSDQFANHQFQQAYFNGMPLPMPSQPQVEAGGMNGNDMMVGMWQDPDAALKRWQMYTGTTVWGKPEDKVNSTPIQRWQEFNDEDCVELLTRLEEHEKKVPEAKKGWGELPSMDNLPPPLQRVQTHQSTGNTQMCYQNANRRFQNNNQNYRRNNNLNLTNPTAITTNGGYSSYYVLAPQISNSYFAPAF